MKLIYNSNFLAITFFLLLSIFALKDLAKPGFYTSHDGETHVARIAQYYLALEDGQIPPRFAKTFYNYLGSPIFVYIYPAPYAIGSFLHFFGYSFVSSFKIQMALGFIFSQIFAYLWLNSLFKDKKAAFIGALFYCWVPYRFLLIYVRGSLSELLAYTFIPLVFYFLTELSRKRSVKLISLTAFSIALVLLSQDLVAFITLPIFAVYTLVLFVKEKSIDFLIKSAIAAIWGFLISAFTYLPALFERQFISLDSATNQAYREHFVCFMQLIKSPWGYGFDNPGCLNDGLSFQIGLAQLLVFAIFILFVIYLLLKKLFYSSNKNRNGEMGFHLILSIIFAVVFLVSIFLMLDIIPNKTLWENFNQLHRIDIPWRLLGLCALSISFITAFVVKYLKSGALFLFLITFAIVANRNHLRINQSVYYTDSQFLNYFGSATQLSEFKPNFGIATPMDFKNRADVLSGISTITNTVFDSNKISFTADVTSQESEIRINKFYFPDIKITDNYQTIGPSKVKLSLNPLIYGEQVAKESIGLPNLTLTKGTHNIIMEYKETKLRLLADYISLFASILLITVLLKYAKS